MKLLFSKKGYRISLADEENPIFLIDKKYYDKTGNEVGPVKSVDHEKYGNWYEYWMDDEGLAEPLKAVSYIEPEWDIDECFGKFGFQNKKGEFVIEPQYAYANEFTQGLACVNLNRTWYKTPHGGRYYENHYGYIDGNGKTVIGFKYNEAYPFNKYNVALAADPEGWVLIDTEGNEIPGTRFPYIGRYYYDNRYLEFSRYEMTGCVESRVGVYDTKERKIICEPVFESFIEENENCLLVYDENSSDEDVDPSCHFINGNGEIIYHWLYNKGFNKILLPDKNNVAAVVKHKYNKLSEISGYKGKDGKFHSRKLIYGLYSSKEEFLLPMEFDEIEKLGDNMWGCRKGEIITVYETEEND